MAIDVGDFLKEFTNEELSDMIYGKNKEIAELEAKVRECSSCAMNYNREINSLKDKISILENDVKEKRDRISFLENRYQNDCIKINQMGVAIDQIVDRMSATRSAAGLK